MGYLPELLDEKGQLSIEFYPSIRIKLTKLSTQDWKVFTFALNHFHAEEYFIYQTIERSTKNDHYYLMKLELIHKLHDLALKNARSIKKSIQLSLDQAILLYDALQKFKNVSEVIYFRSICLKQMTIIGAEIPSATEIHSKYYNNSINFNINH